MYSLFTRHRGKTGAPQYSTAISKRIPVVHPDDTVSYLPKREAEQLVHDGRGEWDDLVKRTRVYKFLKQKGAKANFTDAWQIKPSAGIPVWQMVTCLLLALLLGNVGRAQDCSGVYADCAHDINMPQPVIQQKASANTQENQQVAHWYTDKWFWTGESVIGSSIAADYLSTAMYRGGTETNWLLGPHPSNRKLAIVGASGFTFDSALYVWDWKLSHRDPSKAWRMIGRLGIPVGIAVIEGYAAAHNFETSGRR